MTTIQTTENKEIKTTCNIKIINKKNIGDLYISNNIKDLNHYILINSNTLDKNYIDHVLLNIDLYDYIKDEYKNDVLSALNKTSFYTPRFFILKNWFDQEEIYEFLYYYDEFLRDDFKKDLLILFNKVHNYIKKFMNVL